MYERTINLNVNVNFLQPLRVVFTVKSDKEEIKNLAERLDVESVKLEKAVKQNQEPK